MEATPTNSTGDGSMRATLSGTGRFLLSAMALAGMAGCASSGQQSSFESRLSDRPATVSVRNEQWTDMKISVFGGEAGYRLGVVPAMSSMTFKVPKVVGIQSVLTFV